MFCRFFLFHIQLVAVWKKRHTSTLRLVSGTANLESQGILQIDLKVSKSVYSK